MEASARKTTRAKSAKTAKSKTTAAKGAKKQTSAAKGAKKTTTAKRPRKPAAEKVVGDFIAALERLDVDAAMELCDPNITYQNVPLRPHQGVESTRKILAKMLRPATKFEIEMHNIASDGPVVLTERTDYFEAGRVRAEFWVCGTFEVHDGRITLWRDRFDWADFTLSLAKGGVLAAVAAVRERIGR